MKHDKLYLDIAKRVSEESYAQRLQVGCCIVTENGGIYVGYNGTLPNFVNKCEKDDGTTDESITSHSEQNALYKMMKEGVSTKGATIFITASPCAMCAKMIICAGIKRVVYLSEYRDTSSLDILRQAGVEVEFKNE